MSLTRAGFCNKQSQHSALREDEEFAEGIHTVGSHRVSASACREHACHRHPKRQEREGQYCPPDFLKRRRGLEQKAIEQQERQLDQPKHQVQETIVDSANSLIVLVESDELSLRRLWLRCGRVCYGCLGAQRQLICCTVCDKDCESEQMHQIIPV